MPYIIIGLVILIPVLMYFSAKYGEKKARKSFFDMLFKFGYDTKVKAFKTYNLSAQKNGIVFLGDSITQDYNVYEYLKPYDVYNRGIGGDTTLGVLKRLDESVFQLEPKQVFLMIGTNDFELTDQTTHEIHHNVEEIVKKIHKKLPQCKIMIISTLPVNPTIDIKTVGKRTNAKISELNYLNKNIKHVVYVDAYTKLLKNDVLNPAYTLEGLHLNQEGYTVLTKVLNTYIDK
ncbi:lysophospholipase [Mycoplasmatota bacterium]|nr:lysophospholipase [Mycoplasmatota bacterium]